MSQNIFERDPVGRFAEKENTEPEVALSDFDLSDFLEAPEPQPLRKGEPVLYRQHNGRVIPSEVVKAEGSQVWLRWRDGADAVSGENGLYLDTPDSSVWVVDDRHVDRDSTATWDADSAEADDSALERVTDALDHVANLSDAQVAELGEAYARRSDRLYLGDSGDGSTPGDDYLAAVSHLDDAVSLADNDGRYSDAFAQLNSAYGDAFDRMRHSNDRTARNAGWMVVYAVEAEIVRDLAFDDDYTQFTPEQYELLTTDFQRITGAGK